MTRRPDPRTAEEFLRTFTITIDGPSGSGKTTTARLIAQRLGLRHVDTGAMYRAVTLLAGERGIDAGDAERLGELAHQLDIKLVEASDDREPRFVIGGRDVTDAIRDPRITAAVSAVSSHRSVRAAMVRRQRELAERGGVVLEGRDIGSVVLPWADLKIYLDAVVRVRAERRSAELARAGVAAAVDDVARELEVRDTLDASREASPLMRPVGAFLVDTSDTTIEEQVGRVVALAQAAAEHRARLRAQTKSQRMRFLYDVTIRFVRFIYRVCFGMRVKSFLRPDPAQHYLFASNHISYFDPPAVSVTLPREVHFVAKDTLFKLWWLGPVIRFYNAFPIKRGVFDREAMGHAQTLLESNRSVLIFPEGGRVAGGELGEGRSGVGFLAIRTGVPVVPVYVEGTDRLKACFFRRARVRVVHGKPIRVPAELLAEYRADDDRALYRRYSDMVMAAIQALKERCS